MQDPKTPSDVWNSLTGKFPPRLVVDHGTSEARLVLLVNAAALIAHGLQPAMLEAGAKGDKALLDQRQERLPIRAFEQARTILDLAEKHVATRALGLVEVAPQGEAPAPSVAP